MKKVLTFGLILLMLLPACTPANRPVASQNGIEIYQARVPLPGGEMMSGDSMGTIMALAGFMVIKNTNATADNLLGVSVDFANASVHETKMNGDVMTMEEVAAVEIPAGGSVEFKSGGYHVMLMNPMKELKVGDTVILVLEFEKAGRISVPAEVVAQ